MDYIVDDNPLKWDKYSPGSKIPVVDPTRLESENPEHLVVVPLAWNFFEEIKKRTENIIKEKVSYVRYFPTVETI